MVFMVSKVKTIVDPEKNILLSPRLLGKYSAGWQDKSRTLVWNKHSLSELKHYVAS